MILSFYYITWYYDHDCNLCNLYHSCHSLSFHLVPSKFKIRNKDEKRKEIEKSKQKIEKTLNKKLELEKNKSTVFNSDIRGHISTSESTSLFSSISTVDFLDTRVGKKDGDL